MAGELWLFVLCMLGSSVIGGLRRWVGRWVGGWVVPVIPQGNNAAFDVGPVPGGNGGGASGWPEAELFGDDVAGAIQEGGTFFGWVGEWVGGWVGEVGEAAPLQAWRHVPSTAMVLPLYSSRETLTRTAGAREGRRPWMPMGGGVGEGGKEGFADS